jgi:3-phenylpropionate/trans-cinnamate dioxygenase ferredoxin subunit
MTDTWIDAGAADSVLPEDVAPFEHAGHSYALYRTADDRYYATDGLCTHEQVELADGFVQGTIIECPMHNGRFDFVTGEAKGAPACVNLVTYPVKVEGGRILMKIA